MIYLADSQNSWDFSKLSELSAGLSWVLGCGLASHPPPQDWSPPCTGYGGQETPPCPPLETSLPPVLFGGYVHFKASLSV